MGIFTDQTVDHSKETLVDVLGKQWGVFNKPGTGMFIVKCYRLEGGKKVIDNRVPPPEECTGDWTKREWAVESIKRYINRLKTQTEQQTLRAKQKARNEEREPDAAVAG